MERTDPPVVLRDEAATMDIGEFFAALARRLLLLVPILALALAGWLAYVLLTPSSYLATMSIMIDPRERVPVGIDSPPMPQNPDPFMVESQMRLMTSQPVLQEVVRAEHLETPAKPGLLDPIRRLFNREPASPMERALAQLEKAVVVKRGERSYVVDVEVRAESREKAVAIANALANAFFAAEQKNADAIVVRQREWLDGKLADLRQRVESAERRAQEFRDKQKIAISDGRSSPEAQLKDANAALVQAQTRLAEVEARYGEIRNGLGASYNGGAVAEALRSPVIEKLRADYAQLSRDEAYARTVLGPRHPSYQTILTQMETLRRQIGAEQQRIAHATELELQTARKTRQQAAMLVANLEAAMNKLGDKRLELNDLERNAVNLRAAYEKALATRENIRKDVITTPFGVLLDPPIADALPASPKTIPALFIALGAAFNIWIVSALIAEYRARRNRRPTVVERVVAEEAGGAGEDDGDEDIPAQSHEPHESLREMAPLAHERNDAYRAPQLPQRYGANLGGVEPAVAAGGAYARGVSRILDGALARLRRHDRTPFIAIAGLSRQAGASTLALSLAHVACARGERILIIDHRHGADAIGALTADAEPVTLARAGQNAMLVRKNKDAGAIVVLPNDRARIRAGRRYDDDFDLVLIDCGLLRDAGRMVERAESIDGVIAVAPEASHARLDRAIEDAGLAPLVLATVFTQKDGSRR
ncbi:MAG: GumC family protein [Hyphomicrobiales bacterium]|nr:GumC family protein [Hyphomicrobiales bacterium]